jgi:hypothetical protein
MARQIIKQPNGLYCVWSTIVDDLVLIDATPQDIINELVQKSSKEHTEFVNSTVDALERGEKPYYHYTMTFDEAVKEIRKRHGKNTETLQMLGLAKGKQS